MLTLAQERRLMAVCDGLCCGEATICSEFCTIMIMKAALIVGLIAVLPAAPALAQIKPALAQPKPAAKPKSEAQRSTEPKRAVDACKEFGAGFVAVAGTGTCVQVRGYMRLQGSTR